MFISFCLRFKSVREKNRWKTKFSPKFSFHFNLSNNNVLFTLQVQKKKKRKEKGHFISNIPNLSHRLISYSHIQSQFCLIRIFICVAETLFFAYEITPIFSKSSFLAKTIFSPVKRWREKGNRELFHYKQNKRTNEWGKSPCARKTSGKKNVLKSKLRKFATEA